MQKLGWHETNFDYAKRSILMHFLHNQFGHRAINSGKP